MKDKKDIQQGTLALMVLKTLDAMGPLHGYGIAPAYRADQRRRARAESGHAVSPAGCWDDFRNWLIRAAGAVTQPLHKAASRAAAKDPVLYELLALVDALRDGRMRERQIAERELTARLRMFLRG